MRSVTDVDVLFNENLLRLTPENADCVILSIGRPSDILLSIGIADKEIKLYGNKILKKAREHGYSPVDLENLPTAINNPLLVFADTKYGGHTILTELKINGKNVLVALDVGKGKDAEFNMVKTTFDKHPSGIIGWINKGNLLCVDKQRALDYLGVPELLTGAADNQGLKTALGKVTNFKNPELPIHNIVEKRSPVNGNVKKSENNFPICQKSGNFGVTGTVEAL